MRLGCARTCHRVHVIIGRHFRIIYDNLMLFPCSPLHPSTHPAGAQCAHYGTYWWYKAHTNTPTMRRTSCYTPHTHALSSLTPALYTHTTAPLLTIKTHSKQNIQSASVPQDSLHSAHPQPHIYPNPHPPATHTPLASLLPSPSPQPPRCPNPHPPAPHTHLSLAFSAALCTLPLACSSPCAHLAPALVHILHPHASIPFPTSLSPVPHASATISSSACTPALSIRFSPRRTVTAIRCRAGSAWV